MNSRDVLHRPAAPPDFTVSYGKLPDQIADVRLPATDDGLPLIIFVHGGFWKSEWDRAHAAPLAADLCERGYPIATLEYRRVGGVGSRAGGWPATFDDVAGGITTVPALLDEELVARGMSPIRDRGVVLMGHSAGGQLVLWAGRTHSNIRGVVALAPVADMARAHALSLDEDAVELVLGGAPTEVPERYAAVDPALNLPIGVPTVVVHGDADRQVPQALGRDWSAASVAVGDATRFIGLSNIDHFGVIDPLSLAWPAVIAALASVCGIGRG